ncbi:drug/metabolite transporter (DMT)-like permease [Pedobacter cryoconitis]|uniref:Drug/metabolite transporter (DMT)-like permease n=1 Tax=Pedobacter cryoconitis TaxID=188932 RepID=A0A7W8YST0_9SPHI|nr:DMT family transporter [Pedobacter cryoconitis]MBB5621134.1 drug/metabolite transporter (DMT)-like permease [Pedobacter cryoconitis]
MIYILLSISCSVTVAVLLKLAKRYNIHVLQAVMWNYLAAIILSYIFFRPELAQLVAVPTTLAIAIGVLLPVLFLILGASVRNIGIVKSDIAQRLSLFIPILASLYLFGENFGGLKVAGLLVGFVAIVLTLSRKSTVKTETNSYVYPILVFIGFGLIDVMFKKLALDKSIPYTSTLMVIFCISFIIAAVILGYVVLVRKKKVELINFFCGIVLGCFNFGNILFYMKAHRAMADNPSTVFAAMNMGVIILGSIIGIVLFKEKVSKLNYVGIAMALAAILLITLSQKYAV